MTSERYTLWIRALPRSERSERNGSGSNPSPTAFLATRAASVGVVVACFLALVYAGYRARQPSRR